MIQLVQHFPVLQRELLVAARHRMTYLSRTGSAAVLLTLFAAFYNISGAHPGFTGTHILNILSILVFIECMLTGVRYTSDCLSEERREGTLGLLFLTNLTGTDIVFGKIAARALRATFNLLATFPVLALTIFLGGVTGERVAALSVTLLVCVIFSLSTGILISSRGLRERNVLIGSLIFLLAISFLPLLVNAVAMKRFGFYGFVNILPFLSPYHAFDLTGLGFRPRLQANLAVLLGASVLFLGYAAWRIRHNFGEPEIGSAHENLRARRAFRSLQHSRLDPLAWLALRGRIRISRIAAFVLIIILFGLFSRVAVESRWNWAIPIVFLGSYLLHAFYKFLLVAETCRQLNEDRRSGALELMLVTPVSTVRIVRAQLRATRRVWFPAAVALLLMNYLWMRAPVFDHDRMLMILFPCSVILLVADSITLPWRSVLRSLAGEAYTLTVFKVFFRTIVPPLAVIAFMLAFAIAAKTPRFAENCFIVWTVLCLIYNTALVVNARLALRHFRLFATGDKLASRTRGDHCGPCVIEVSTITAVP